MLGSQRSQRTGTRQFCVCVLGCRFVGFRSVKVNLDINARSLHPDFVGDTATCDKMLPAKVVTALNWLGCALRDRDQA